MAPAISTGAEVEEAVVGGCYVGSEACAETRFHLGLQVQTEHQTKDIPYSTGMRVHVDLSDFGLLDFPQARAIYRGSVV